MSSFVSFSAELGAGGAGGTAPPVAETAYRPQGSGPVFSPERGGKPVCRNEGQQGSALRQGKQSQHSFAPAGTLSSMSIRCSFSSPFSLWTAEISIPQLGMPIILRGGRFRMAMAVLPIRSSGS